MFESADKDGDGVITAEEIEDMKSKMKGKRHGKWHKRGDGPRPE